MLSDCLLLPLSPKKRLAAPKECGSVVQRARDRGLRLLSHALFHFACAGCVVLRNGGLLARLGSHEIITMIPSEGQGQMQSWSVLGCASS